VLFLIKTKIVIVSPSDKLYFSIVNQFAEKNMGAMRVYSPSEFGKVYTLKNFVGGFLFNADVVLSRRLLNLAILPFPEKPKVVYRSSEFSNNEYKLYNSLFNGIYSLNPSLKEPIAEKDLTEIIDLMSLNLTSHFY